MSNQKPVEKTFLLPYMNRRIPTWPKRADIRAKKNIET